MYQAFYNLSAKPFQITSDPKFIWLGEKHKEALATLKYGIIENKGFLLLTGDIGTGKTALINCLIRIIDVATLVATIPDPGLDSLDFFNLLSDEFKMNRKFDSKGAFLIHLKRFLHQAHQDEKKVLLIIDEAQRLNHELLEQIRLLSNIEMNNRKLINIFFVGQTEFNKMLMEERNKAVRQRISVNYHIDSLSENETYHYIRHRLKVAGATREIFNSEAMKEIYAFSRGVPRLINIICDHALLTGYAAGKKNIDVKTIKECERELRIPIEVERESQKATVSNPESTIAAGQSSEQLFGKRTLFGLIIILLLLFGGYLLYSIESKDTPRWAIDDIAPQNYESSLLEEKENFVPDSDDVAESEGGTVPSASGEAASTPSLAEATEPAVETAQSQSEKPETQQVMPFPGRKIVIYFQHNSNELPDQALETLDRIAEFMIHNPQASLKVSGYTDSTGSYSYNVSVSQFRANSIKSYLVGKGVKFDKINAEGLGPENPIESNDTAEGRKKNRRVELELDIEQQQ